MMRRAGVASIAALAMLSCARPTQFDRYVSAGQWSDAAREFAADASLRNNEHALYQAGVLFGTPRLSTYDPAKARDLFSSLVTRFPESPQAAEATARLLLLEDVLVARRDATLRERELERQIAALTREMRDMRARADSVLSQNDSLRLMLSRLEIDRREREEQLRALRLELQKLKEIDLKPRAPPRPIKP